MQPSIIRSRDYKEDVRVQVVHLGAVGVSLETFLLLLLEAGTLQLGFDRCLSSPLLA
jgi:hypothetical protein